MSSVYVYKKTAKISLMAKVFNVLLLRID